MDKYLKYFKENEKNILNILEEFVMKETPSYNKDLNDETANWLKEEFIALTNGDAKVIETEIYGNHVLAEYGEGDKQLLILSHYDTVWSKNTVKDRPFYVSGNKVSGPGVFDMKYGLLMGIFAIKAIKDLNIKLNKKVVFLFDSDEEIGNPSSRYIIEKIAKESERAFILEPSINGSLKTSRKGTAEFDLKIKGVPSHSGVNPQNGVSAINELAEQIIYLHSLNDFSVGNTVNVGIVNGGSRVNVIAEYAEAKVDVRAKTKEELEKITNLIFNLKPINDEVHLEITGGINRPPLEISEEINEMFNTAKNIASKNLKFDLTEKSTGGGSDGNLTSQFIPTLDGLGAVGDGAHANNEHILLNESFIRGALLANLIEHYGTE